MNKKHKLLIAIVVLWLVLFLFSTKIVLLLSGYYLPSSPSHDIQLSETINFHIERFSEPEGVLGVVRFEGWAFNMQYEPETEKNVSLIFKNENQIYEVKTFGYSRLDVAESYAQYNLTPEGLGFTGSFSIFALKDGTYEVFIKVWEDGKSAEMMFTNRIYSKVNNAFFFSMESSDPRSFEMENSQFCVFYISDKCEYGRNLEGNINIHGYLSSFPNRFHASLGSRQVSTIIGIIPNGRYLASMDVGQFSNNN